MLTEDDKKFILKEFLTNIANIANIKYQRKIWIEGKGPEVQDFDEIVDYFFLEGDDILKNYKKFDITEQQYQLLMKFRDAFEIFSDENDFPEKFIDTPQWNNIVSMAKEVLQAFHYPKEADSSKV
ncbi:MAG: hypothetical protein Tsb0015_17520 [Simkaniaceae bacterium]